MLAHTDTDALAERVADVERFYAARGGATRARGPAVGVRVGIEVVAVGWAVADTGAVGVFGMATRPEARGRGIAGSVLATLAGWAAAGHNEQMPTANRLQVDPRSNGRRLLEEQEAFLHL